jgi:1,4-dihydroxy-2-naphthoate octaprenyltransferase
MIPNLRPLNSFRLRIGKADGELLHKLLAVFAYPSTLCFFAFMLVAQVPLLITEHSAALFFVSLKLASL